MKDLDFHSNFVFRAPALSFSPSSLTEEGIKEIVKRKDFAEAIYIASPVLYEEMQRWIRNELKDIKGIEKLVTSLYKYLSRMQSRCTPYGVFASCSVGKWDNQNEIVLPKEMQKHARLDMNFVCALGQHLMSIPEVRNNLFFYTNNSAYQVGSQIRYVKYQYNGNLRTYNIVSIQKTDILELVLALAVPGIEMSTLSDTLLSKGKTQEEVEKLIQDLLENQLLISELEPSVTGDEFIDILINVIKKIAKKTDCKRIHVILESLNKVQQILGGIENTSTAEVSVYQEVVTLLKSLNIEVDEKNLFQVDAYKASAGAVLNKELKKSVYDALEFLQDLSPILVNTDLERFKSRFIDLYDEQEVPLLEALDTESGIGYPDKDAYGINPIVDDIQLQSIGGQSTQMTWDWRQNFLMDKLIKAYKSEDYTISFTQEDLSSFPTKEARLPTSFSTCFRILDPTQHKIQVSFIAGHTSASTLLGRFAHGNKEMNSLLNDVVFFEQECVNDKIIAEIAHLPQDRIGNLLLRPVLGEYEIPYLASSTLPLNKQLQLNDLLISIRNNRIVIRSKSLNKEIMPRLSSAHNYSVNSLPAYKFLCELQAQNITTYGLGFTWGKLSKNFKFLPRAEYKNAVLSPATWNLNSSDYGFLVKSLSSEDIMQRVLEWKQKWKMPDCVLLKDNDNELLIDLRNELSVKVFLQTLKKRQIIELVEFLFDPELAITKDEDGNPYTNEIIGVVFNKKEKNEVAVNTVNKFFPSKKVERSFILGSEWLYYKIYCGVKTSDTLLISTISGLVRDLKNQRLLEKWFFIRYLDPEPHLRLRFFNTNTQNNLEIIKRVNALLNPLLKAGLITKILTDTYQRELERYGSETIDLAEDYFHFDSQTALAVLEVSDNLQNENLKWLYAARITDELLDGLKFDLHKKAAFMDSLKENYLMEHGSGKHLVRQLDNKFRSLRAQLEQIIDRKQDYSGLASSIVHILYIRKMQFKPISDRLLHLRDNEQLEVDFGSLLLSYLHMSFNRIFKAKQRTHELLVYYILSKYYKSEIARRDKKTELKLQN